MRRRVGRPKTHVLHIRADHSQKVEVYVQLMCLCHKMAATRSATKLTLGKPDPSDVLAESKSECKRAPFFPFPSRMHQRDRASPNCGEEEGEFTASTAEEPPRPRSSVGWRRNCPPSGAAGRGRRSTSLPRHKTSRSRSRGGPEEY